MSYGFRFCFTDYVFCLLILTLDSLVKTNIISIVIYIIILYVIPTCRLHIYLEIFTSLDYNSITYVIDLLFIYKCHDFKHLEHVSGFTINLYNYDLHHLCEYIVDEHLSNTVVFYS